MTSTVSTFEINGLQMQVTIAGRGPLVVLCHGFPELALSWRAQIEALASAGYRVAAPDMRGYGGTSAPEDVSAYTMLHLVGDMVELVRKLEDKQAVIVGHDWGAAVAWNAALLRPDLFRAVVGMSVPFSPSGRTDLLSSMRAAGIDNFYMQYFQTPGVAEAELERDAVTSIRKLMFNGSGDGPDRIAFGMVPKGTGILDDLIEPDTLPDWLTEKDVAQYAAEFARTGFRGGLNWYRAIALSFQLMAPWRGQVIKQPSLFIAGERDDLLKFPNAKKQLENFSTTLPQLRGCHILPGAGHWIQRERAAEVNRLLIDFLDTL